MSRRTLVRIASFGLVGNVGITCVNSLRNREIFCMGSRKDRADILAMECAAESYAESHDGAFPSSLADLVRPDAFGNTYLKGTTIPLDPYRRAYRYEPPDAEFDFPRIWTYGRDGLPGGEDEDQDVGNWMFRW